MALETNAANRKDPKGIIMWIDAKRLKRPILKKKKVVILALQNTESRHLVTSSPVQLKKSFRYSCWRPQLSLLRPLV